MSDVKDTRWTIIGEPFIKNNRTHVLCRCSCEAKTEREMILYAVRCGKSRSCGCLPAELVRARRKSHGDTVNRVVSVEHTAWTSMLRRCYSEYTESYKRYGARGITVCDSWRTSFATFLADVGRRPSAAHSLDRIDNSGNYEPGNVRWATREEQQRNKSNNRRLTYDGRTLTVTEWAEVTGISRRVLFSRLWQMWSVEATLTTPVNTAKSHRRK